MSTTRASPPESSPIATLLGKIKQTLNKKEEEIYLWKQSNRTKDAVITLMKNKKCFVAFDFDGVLCDSARETGISSYCALLLLLPPEQKQQLPTKPREEMLQSFCKIRPLLETGYEALILWYRLLILKENPDDMLNSLTPELDLENGRGKLNISVEELSKAFQQTRDEWIENNEQDWLDANGFFLPAVNALRTLLQTNNKHVYIISTKHVSFVKKLLFSKAAGIPKDALLEENIFGLGSGKKSDILHNLLKTKEIGRVGIFIEDRIETLKKLNNNSPSLVLIVAGYGYNTAQERKKCDFLIKDTPQELYDFFLLNGNIIQF